MNNQNTPNQATLAQDPTKEPLSTQAIDQVECAAQLLKSAADPLRLEILSVLATDSFGVLELCALFETKQSGMSHHLKVLSKAGLVITRREGNSIFYRRNSSISGAELGGAVCIDLKNSIFRCADQLHIRPHVQQHINEVYKRRAEASQAFFIEHAEQFREQQDLIARFDVYAKPVTELIERQPKAARALEIGPGTGEFLPVLSAHYQHVVGLDTTQTMLEKSAALAKDLSLKNIELIHGDTQYCNDHFTHESQLFDCVVINMVLHHTPSPSQIISDVSAVLKAGGSLFISDLCRHDQDWARKACGDQWLGFEPSDITQWCDDNDLSETQNMYIALRNGFQIQIRQFTK